MGEIRSVEYASRKLTPTEGRYGISEKELFAIVWGIQEFNLELRGRQFTLETDHKALEQIREEPDFINNRLNIWIEKIQEYNLKVRYVKGEDMGLADKLSRNQNEKGIRKVEKTKETRWKNHTIRKGEKQIWKFDNGKKEKYRKRLNVET
ncbi:Retrovirus-related Pol polyprotein from transposon 17.6 [Cucumispora dikerogammari]|nr:Retrovirus-related Pol polyprotein from transposon 17.6 [Cucumispora dikerogammari]